MRGTEEFERWDAEGLGNENWKVQRKLKGSEREREMKNSRETILLLFLNFKFLKN